MLPRRLGPRFALEALFLIALAVGAGLADLGAMVIVVIMLVAWVLVALLEYTSDRLAQSFPPLRRFHVPAPPHDVAVPAPPPELPPAAEAPEGATAITPPPQEVVAPPPVVEPVVAEVVESPVEEPAPEPGVPEVVAEVVEVEVIEVEAARQPEPEPAQVAEPEPEPEPEPQPEPVVAEVVEATPAEPVAETAESEVAAAKPSRRFWRRERQRDEQEEEAAETLSEPEPEPEAEPEVAAAQRGWRFWRREPEGDEQEPEPEAEEEPRHVRLLPRRLRGEPVDEVAGDDAPVEPPDSVSPAPPVAELGADTGATELPQEPPRWRFWQRRGAGEDVAEGDETEEREPPRHVRLLTDREDDASEETMEEQPRGEPDEETADLELEELAAAASWRRHVRLLTRRRDDDDADETPPPAVEPPEADAEQPEAAQRERRSIWRFGRRDAGADTDAEREDDEPEAEPQPRHVRLLPRRPGRSRAEEEVAEIFNEADDEGEEGAQQG